MPSKSTDIDITRLAWLLRADLRNGKSAAAAITEEFKVWLMTGGMLEYSVWKEQRNSSIDSLLKPLDGWPRYRCFGLSPLLHYLIKQRKDLRAIFDIHSAAGLWHAIAWLFTHGLREYDLLGSVDAEMLAELNRSPPCLQLPASPSEDRPAITWLMFFVWRCDENLQRQFDLRSLKGQTDYLLWFLFHGVPELQLAPLLASRWYAWLRQPVALTQNDPAVPRAILLMWKRRDDLQLAFDLRSPAGWAGLAHWAQEAVAQEPGLHWILANPADDIQHSSDIHALPQRPWGVNLIGFAFGELGIGEDVRMAAAACEAAGIPFTVINIHPGDHLRQADKTLSAHVGGRPRQDEAPYAINVFCLTGFHTAQVFLERGLPLFAGRYNIGWWPWELPVWPRDWHIALDIVDEIWAATTFTHQMYANAQQHRSLQSRAPAKLEYPQQTQSTLTSHIGAQPLTLMPLPVCVARVKPISRRRLGLPLRRFLFLYVFDFNSYLARKNPFAAVRAFRKAFAPGDDSVGLVFKTMNSNPRNPIWRRFLRECARDARIQILDKTLDRGEVLGLIKSCDAYLSLHRSEGFGRTLAEAMLFGKPVVGTNFSGNVDFLNPDVGFPVQWKRRAVLAEEYPYVTNADKAWWAEPDLADAAQQMRAARMAASDRQFSAKVKAFAEKQFSPARIGNLIKQRLQEISDRQ